MHPAPEPPTDRHADAAPDFPAAIASFVDATRALVAAEKERDQLRAAVARVEAKMIGASPDDWGVPCLYISQIRAALDGDT